MNISKLYRNWPVHNIIGHPACEITFILLRLCRCKDASEIAAKVHHATVPEDH